MTDTNDLHLPDLTIEGFMGIDSLSIPRLGRVTLIVGRNGVGKTTMLDAVRLYADRGRIESLSNLLLRREEAVPRDEDGELRYAPEWNSLFHGWTATEESCISIGPRDDAKRLTVKLVTLSDEQAAFLRSALPDIAGELRIQAVESSYGGYTETAPLNVPVRSALAQLVPQSAWRQVVPKGFFTIGRNGGLPPAIKCVPMKAGAMDKGVLMQLWDSVALTDDEERIIEAIAIALGPRILRIGVVGDNSIAIAPGYMGRRWVVRLKGLNHPVPLASLGDGAVHMFEAAVALANSRNGFLLIDEAANGLHYSVHEDYWRMVLRTAQENNVQVLATTHSWDCVSGFAKAAKGNVQAEGALVRLDRRGDGLKASWYSEKNLSIAAEQRIEVR